MMKNELKYPINTTNDFFESYPMKYHSWKTQYEG